MAKAEAMGACRLRGATEAEAMTRCPTPEGVEDVDVAEQAVSTNPGLEDAAVSRRSSLRYDIFLSHLQRNAQDAIIAMQLFLREARPGIQIFVDVDVDMDEGLTETIRNGVQNCGAFVFFITDGVLASTWCAQELRWALEHRKRIVLVRETDARHGGIDMKDFFQQVPEDLLPVFRNNVAIPWYREKGFRGVSVHAILRRAHLEDTHVDGLKKLEKTKRELHAIFNRAEQPTTCFDLIQERCLILRVVFFMGGFAQFRGKRAQRAYDVIFSSSFWFCATLCTANLFLHRTPYHLQATDLITAYVHVPAWQSWLVWRRFVRSRGCEELLAKAQANDEQRAVLDAALRVGGRLVLLLQCIMVADVLVGWALPGILEDPHAMSGEMLPSYTFVHSVAMWLFVPPVVAAMMGSYVMFGFTALLHWLDIQATRDLLSECVGPLAGFYETRARPSCFQAASNGGRAAPGAIGVTCGAPPHVADLEAGAAHGEEPVLETVDSLQEWQRKSALQENLFETVAELLVDIVDGVQTRIDHTCGAISSLWVHLVAVSTYQVLVVACGIQAHVTGVVQLKYHWWWAFQDVFHVSCGIVLTAAALGVFCIVTSSMARMPRYAYLLLRQAGCPVVRQARVLDIIGSRPLGMHMCRGAVYIDLPKAIGFVIVVALIMANDVLLLVDIAGHAPAPA